MNKLIKIIAFVMFSAVSLVSSVSADSSNFAGPYVGVTASVAGVELDGVYKDPDMGVHTSDKGQAGMVGAFGSIQAGYNIPLNEIAFMTVGAAYTPTGDASFAGKDVVGNKNVTLELSDLVEAFIEPSFSVTSQSAMFVHLGYTTATLDVKGTDVQNKDVDLDGYTVSTGLKVITDAGVFLKAELGMTEYDGITIRNITGVDGNATATATADTKVAFGALTVGKKF